MADQTSSLAQPCHDINLLRMFCKCRDADFRNIFDDLMGPSCPAFAKGTQSEGSLSGLTQNGARCGFDRLGKFDRSQNRRATAPTQNPALDFREAGQFQAQVDTTVLQ